MEGIAQFLMMMANCVWLSWMRWSSCCVTVWWSRVAWLVMYCVANLADPIGCPRR
jgi:predicted tellurium resistance membrane protein TerC